VHTMKDPGIIFMGTPEFAVESLRSIINAGFTVKGVVTAPDKPSGRGLQLHASPVKEFALAHKLNVFEPHKLKDQEFINKLKDLRAGLFVVVAFRMLPEEIWSMPEFGTFNLHASLLPQYRGAAPVNWAIINGEKKTGLTTFYINHAIDEGKIILSKEVEIGSSETAGELHDRLMVMGGDLVVKTIERITSGQVNAVEQTLPENKVPLKTAPKIHRNQCKINWNREAEEIFNFVRGLSPYPGAWTELMNQKGEILTLKLFFTQPSEQPHKEIPGNLISDGKTFLKAAVRNGFVFIEKLQLQGKKPMNVNEFLRGFPSVENCRLL